MLSDECRPQRVLVVDDQELVQAGLRALLSRESWVAACYSAGSVDIAWEAALRWHPQIVVVSMSIAGRSGLEVCHRFRERMPHVRVMLMSGDGRVSASLAATHGAVGFLPKRLPAAAIVGAVRRVAEGGRAFPHESECQPAVQLSRREMDVLQHLVSGLSNPEVAAQLNLSRHTVKQHTSVVYRKLGVRNRAQAASRAQELGFVA
ncbi:response regulator transcription factor [Streptomyces spongiae]|nr:response regulator transcription factor [Streptomyces spongiae]